MIQSSTVLRALIGAVVAGLVTSSGGQAQAGLAHQYQLNGSYADDFSGPSLSPAGGTLGPTSYSFGANQGLSLSNALSDAANYSIETVFNFSSLSGYRKIIDFKDLSSDTGLYNLNTALNFYNVATGPTGAFAPNVDARLVITRDSTTDLVNGYVNGTLQISFTDSSGLGIFSAANNIIQFFKDDFATGQREASDGVVDLIRIYDAPLTAAEVAALSNPDAAVPEPSTLVACFVAGLFSVTAYSRRRRITG